MSPRHIFMGDHFSGHIATRLGGTPLPHSRRHRLGGVTDSYCLHTDSFGNRVVRYFDYNSGTGECVNIWNDAGGLIPPGTLPCDSDGMPPICSTETGIACPPGEILQPDGTCQPTMPVDTGCPGGEPLINGQCSSGAIACANGDGTYTLREIERLPTGDSVLTGRILSTNATRAEAQQFGVHIVAEDDTRCVPTAAECPRGEELQPDGSCAPIPVVCPEGEELSPDGLTCAPIPVVCPEGEELSTDGLTCVPIPVVCPEGEDLSADGLTCLPIALVCPEGEELSADGLTCLPTPVVCPKGEELSPDGLTCVSIPVVCPEGEELQADGSCAQIPPTLTCPSGQILQDDGTCLPIPPDGEVPPLACEENGIYDLYDADTGELISSGISELNVPADAIFLPGDDPRCGVPVITPPPVDDEFPTAPPIPPPPTGGFPGPAPTGADPWVPPATVLPPSVPPPVGLPGQLAPPVEFPIVRPDGRIPITTPDGTPLQVRPDGGLLPLVFPCSGGGWPQLSSPVLGRVRHQPQGSKLFADTIYRAF